MNQIKHLVNQCRAAINSGMPIIYIESDDIGLVDELLHTGKLAEFWRYNLEEEPAKWERFKEKEPEKGTRPDNIRVSNHRLPSSFFWISNSQRHNKTFSGPDSLVVEGMKPIIKNERSVRYIHAVRDFEPDQASEGTLINHVAAVVNSNEDDDIRKCVILLQSPTVKIPKGLEPYVELIEVIPPDDETIREIIQNFAISKSEKPYEKLMQLLVVNLRGFNPRKIKDVLSRIYLNCQGLFTIKSETEGIKLIREVKQQMLKKEGLLKIKYVDPKTEVSGLARLRDWLETRAELFIDPIKAEKQWNLSIPKGILVSGVPGTGKSALANQISISFRGLPILQFDMGSVLGKYTGESEGNLRKVLRMAEAMAPCVLWIDEIEKAFSSASSSGDSDGGQGKRLFGQFLTWMQEKKEACFIFATANDISALPPEFLRRGRFDQKFYTFMPSRDDCIEIFINMFRRFNGPSKPFDKILSADQKMRRELENILTHCGKKGKFMTGADIEGIVKDAMFAYYQKYWRGKVENPEEYDPEKFYNELLQAVNSVQTYGETDMHRVVECLFNLAKNRFLPASASDNLISLNDVDLKNLEISDFKGKFNGYDEMLHRQIKEEAKFFKESRQNRKNF